MCELPGTNARIAASWMTYAPAAITRCPHQQGSMTMTCHTSRHREERSDDAIQGRKIARAALDRRAAKRRLAMTGRGHRTAILALPPTRCDVIHHGCWEGGQHA